MNKIQSVCIFCSSSNNVDKKYRNTAKSLAHILSENNITIIYGGGNTGMMGDIANTCLENKSEIIGIIPKFLKERENLHPRLSKTYIEDDMHTRKMKMYKLSDMFVCLPGGLGTLDEFIEIIAWKQLGLHNKNIILINTDNYWDKLLSIFKDMYNKRFIYQNNDNLFNVIDKVEKIVSIIK